MSSIKGVLAQVESAKMTVEQAPFTTLQEALGAVSIGGVQENQTALDHRLAEIRQNRIGADAVKNSAEAAKGVFSIAAGAHSSEAWSPVGGMPEPAREALTAVSQMSRQAEESWKNISAAEEALTEAAEAHLLFMKALDKYNQLIFNAEFHAGKSQEEQRATIDAMTRYQLLLSGQ